MQQAEGANLKLNLDLLYAMINAYKSVSAFKEVTAMLQPLLDTSYRHTG